MATQTLTTFTIENKEFYERTMLESFKEQCFLYNFAKKATLPKNHGNTISWRKMSDLSLPTAPLTEGVTPTANKFEITEYRTTVNQHGDYIELSDILEYESIDPVTTELAEKFGQQIDEYIDKQIRNVLDSGLNVYYAGGTVTSSANVSATISTSDINKIMAILKRYNKNNKPKGKYIFMISPEVELDLKALTTNDSWIDVNKYADPSKIIEGEIGTFLGFRFIVDNNITIDDNGVHKCLVFSEGAYGTVMLEGDSNKPSLIHKGLGSAGTADPLEQRQTLGWKINGVATRILYDEALIRYEVRPTLEAPDAIDDSTRTHYSAKNTGN